MEQGGATRRILVRTCIATLGLDIRDRQVRINKLHIILGQAKNQMSLLGK